MTSSPTTPSGPTSGGRGSAPAIPVLEISDDSGFGKSVVDYRLATPDEVQACLAKQKELEKQGQKVPLQELLIRAGYLTNTQAARLSGTSDDSMTRPAQQIPGFQIIKRVGAGAMATVYMAKQLSLDRVVAIKVLPRRLSENREFVERFYKEGRAAAKLNHNNIVQAIDVGEHAGFHYFVMEFIDGRTVYDDLIKHKTYNEKDAIQIILQIASALEHANHRGLIHRDVKPKNIMLTNTGVAKLADMGLAREADDVKAAMAEAGRAYGTPYYISPEQIRGEVKIDFRSDLYSLGATFYHMLTGRVPFDGATPSIVMQKHLKEPLIPPDHLNKKLSTGVAEVIEVMMAKEAQGRYASMVDLISDLEAVQRGQPPLQARQRYDAQLLQGLADGAETHSPNRIIDTSDVVRVETNWNALIVVSALLLVSVILNIFLAMKLSG